MSYPDAYLGIDLGTSGVRAAVIDANDDLLALRQAAWRGEGDDPAEWWSLTCHVIAAVVADCKHHTISRLAVDGTSTTVLLTRAGGVPASEVLMYHDTRCSAEAALLSDVVPADCGARGSTSSLAKFLYLRERNRMATRVTHQAEWICGQLLARHEFCDENNAMKLGYDAIRRRWPDWVSAFANMAEMLPQVVPAGTALGSVDISVARATGLGQQVTIVAGTTDGVASFIAAGADQVGDAVTALGSTMVLKLLSATPVFAADYGIYSHRLGDQWLAGGASNSGGQVLLDYFTPEQMHAMTPALQPDQSTGLDYYPLRKSGERFPVNDPDLAPRLDPRPDDDSEFFQAMLEGMAQIEKRGYALLDKLGASPLRSVRTVGGGASNPAWTAMRQHRLAVPFQKALHTDAAAGAAILARRGPQHA